MSLHPETFYAMRCDFPGCGDTFDWDGEFTHYVDPDTAQAIEAGWFVDDGGAVAFCSTHTIAVECPPDLRMLSFDASAIDDTYCTWCEENGTDQHLAPMPDTWESQIKLSLDRITERAHAELDVLEAQIVGGRYHRNLGELGKLAERTDAALIGIWERTCRAWNPDISPRDLREMRRSMDTQLGAPRSWRHG